MRCKICGSESNRVFSYKILNKYDINYFYCENCKFLQTEEPYWLDEAYAESINISDTGYMQRNIDFSAKLTILLSIFFDTQSTYLDFAGGYGVFVRLMRDVGFDFVWDDKYTQNLFAKKFEYKDDLNIKAITSFESFEHFENPIKEIEKMMNISKNIIFSTEILPMPIPKPSEWWYYGIEHGQHISFYSDRTLKFIANKYGLNYYNINNGLHIFTQEKKPSYIKFLPKLTKIGLHKVIGKAIKSKTWDDHILTSKSI